MTAPLIRIRTRGPFAVESLARGDITPSGRKARGLLALLAMAPDHSHEKAWLREHLWPRSGASQASNSLNQEISKLRRAWGPDAAALLGYKTSWVALDPALVALDASGDGALLEGLGLGVDEPRFQAWLERQRRADGEGVQAPAPSEAAWPGPDCEPAGGGRTAPEHSRIVIRCLRSAGEAGAGQIGAILAHQIAEGIGEQIRSRRVVQVGDEAPDGEVDIDVRCDVVEAGGESVAFVCLTHPPSGEVLFTRRCRADGPAAMLLAQDAVNRTAHEAAERAVGRLPQVLGLDRSVMKAAALGRLALLRMFRYDEPAIAEADELLGRAHEADPNGVFLAWRGFLKLATWVDLGRSKASEQREVIEALTREAAEAAPLNSVAQGLVAYTQAMLLGDAQVALPAAARATEMNPTNPIPLVSMASVQLLAGRLDEAYAMSRRARAYAEGSRYSHFFDNHHCVVCMATGRHDEAMLAAEAAAAALPSFAAANRHLMALHAHRGNLDAAERVRARLVEADPAFSVDRMVNDPDYPARTLRRMGLLHALRRIA